MSWRASLVLVALVVGCGGDDAPPFGSANPTQAPVDEPAPEPAPAGANKVADCDGETCRGVWRTSWVRYVVFPDATEALDPRTAVYEDVPGVFDIRFVPASGGEVVFSASSYDDGTLYKDWELPFPARLSMTFEKSMTVDFEVTNLSGTYPDIECHFEILQDGTLVGALVREPGIILCSTNNWAAPQNQNEPGILVEYDVCNSEGLSVTPPC